jgi:hypothetical protein
MKTDRDSLAYTVPATVYYLKGEPYFPHYSERNVYVNGFDKSTASSAHLIAMGATPQTHRLWPRHWL